MGGSAVAEFTHRVCHFDNYFMSCFFRIVSLSNRPADHEIIRARLNCHGRRGDTFLIVCWAAKRSNSWSNDHKLSARQTLYFRRF
jgi:hypothetical protein